MMKIQYRQTPISHGEFYTKLVFPKESESCCPKILKALRDSFFHHATDRTGRFHLKMWQGSKGMEITHCPFCGEEFEYENIKFPIDQDK